MREKLSLWQRYQKDQKELLSFLRAIETEQSHLNLRYIYMRTVDPSMRKIEVSTLFERSVWFWENS